MNRFAAVTGGSSSKPLTISVTGDTLTATSGTVVYGSWSSPALTAGAFGTATRAGIWSNYASSYFIDNVTVTGR